MKTRTYICPFFLGCILHFSSPAQNIPSDSASIQQHFNTTIDEAGNYKDYKVVKQVALEELKDHTLARINGLKDSMQTLTNEVNELSQQLGEEKEQKLQLKQRIKEFSAAKNNLQIAGLSIPKLYFHLFLCTCIALLALGLIVFILKYRNANEKTKVAVSNLQLTEKDLENLQRRSMEREQQLSSQLMDERKKNHS